MNDLIRTVKGRVKKCMQWPSLYILRKFNGVDVSEDVQVHGKVWVTKSKNSEIHLGPGVILNAVSRRNTLEARGPIILKTLRPDAELIIGANTGLTSATVSAATSIRIGERVLIGAGVLITDSDHHVIKPIEGTRRRFLGFPQPERRHRVVIEDDVFIGARSVVLKGITIGTGSVIGAGSIVVSDIPPNVVACGNPCRVVKSLLDGAR